MAQSGSVFGLLAANGLSCRFRHGERSENGMLV